MKKDCKNCTKINTCNPYEKNRHCDEFCQVGNTDTPQVESAEEIPRIENIIGGNATDFANKYKPDLSQQRHSELQSMLKEFAISQLQEYAKQSSKSEIFGHVLCDLCRHKEACESCDADCSNLELTESASKNADEYVKQNASDEWISVNDRYPNQDEAGEIEVIHKDYGICISDYSFKRFYHKDIGQKKILFFDFDSITHWRKIPNKLTNK